MKNIPRRLGYCAYAAWLAMLILAATGPLAYDHFPPILGTAYKLFFYRDCIFP